MKGRTRYLAIFALVFLGFCLTILVLGRITWALSPAGKADFEELMHLDVPAERAPTKAKGIHRIEEWPASRGRNFNEAPSLKDMVETGELPPVSDRLPEDPLVIVPPEQIGPYGGLWLNYSTGPEDMRIQDERINYTGLVRWDPMYQEYLPDVAKRWEISEDGLTFTFWLRKGIRWSDGEPFTARDVEFYYKYVLQEPGLINAIPLAFRPKDQLAALEIIDDYTLKFKFGSPSGLFMDAMANGQSESMCAHPAHYMKQFHPAFTPQEELDRKIAESGFSTWVQLYRDRAYGTNPLRPSIAPWISTTEPPNWPMIFKRNPYYWKVDPAGNQLPYIDAVRFDNYEEKAIQLRALRGDIGHFFRTNFLKEQDYPLYMQNRKSGNYRVVYRVHPNGMTHTVCINLSHRNPEMRKVFSNIDFRRAMSLAINREQINEACFMGWGFPRQVTPYEYSPLYNAEYEKAYTEYDTVRANALLDSAGLDKRDDDGYRLLPNGEPLAIFLECSTAFTVPDVAELVARYWREVGVRTDIKVISRQLHDERLRANDVDAAMWHGGSLVNPIFDPRSVFPDRPYTRIAPAYGEWFFKDRQSGEMPPPDIKKAMELYWKITETPHRDKQLAMFSEILDLSQAGLWHIGIVGGIPAFNLVSNDFHNVAEVSVDGRYSPGEIAPECFAIGQE